MATNPFFQGPLDYGVKKKEPDPFFRFGQALDWTGAALGKVAQGAEVLFRPTRVIEQLGLGLIDELSGQRGALMRGVRGAAQVGSFGAFGMQDVQDPTERLGLVGGTLYSLATDPANLLGGAGVAARGLGMGARALGAVETAERASTAARVLRSGAKALGGTTVDAAVDIGRGLRSAAIGAGDALGIARRGDHTYTASMLPKPEQAVYQALEQNPHADSDYLHALPGNPNKGKAITASDGSVTLGKPKPLDDLRKMADFGAAGAQWYPELGQRIARLLGRTNVGGEEAQALSTEFGALMALTTANAPVSENAIASLRIMRVVREMQQEGKWKNTDDAFKEFWYRVRGDWKDQGYRREMMGYGDTGPTGKKGFAEVPGPKMIDLEDDYGNPVLDERGKKVKVQKMDPFGQPEVQSSKTGRPHPFFSVREGRNVFDLYFTGTATIGAQKMMHFSSDISLGGIGRAASGDTNDVHQMRALGQRNLKGVTPEVITQARKDRIAGLTDTKAIDTIRKAIMDTAAPAAPEYHYANAVNTFLGSEHGVQPNAYQAAIWATGRQLYTDYANADDIAPDILEELKARGIKKPSTRASLRGIDYELGLIDIDEALRQTAEAEAAARPSGTGLDQVFDDPRFQTEVNRLLPLIDQGINPRVAGRTEVRFRGADWGDERKGTKQYSDPRGHEERLSEANALMNEGLMPTATLPLEARSLIDPHTGQLTPLRVLAIPHRVLERDGRLVVQLDGNAQTAELAGAALGRALNSERGVFFTRPAEATGELLGGATPDEYNAVLEGARGPMYERGVRAPSAFGNVNMRNPYTGAADPNSLEGKMAALLQQPAPVEKNIELVQPRDFDPGEGPILGVKRRYGTDPMKIPASANGPTDEILREGIRIDGRAEGLNITPGGTPATQAPLPFPTSVFNGGRTRTYAWVDDATLDSLMKGEMPQGGLVTYSDDADAPQHGDNLIEVLVGGQTANAFDPAVYQALQQTPVEQTPLGSVVIGNKVLVAKPDALDTIEVLSGSRPDLDGAKYQRPLQGEKLDVPVGSVVRDAIKGRQLAANAAAIGRQSYDEVTGIGREKDQQDDSSRLTVPPEQAFSAMQSLQYELQLRSRLSPDKFRAWATDYAPRLAKGLGISPYESFELIRYVVDGAQRKQLGQ